QGREYDLGFTVDCRARYSMPSPESGQNPSLSASAVPARSVAAHLLLGASLVLIAFNLRPLFSSLSVLLPEIIQATPLTSAGAGYLTTLPVLCLGLFAPVAPRLSQRIGPERCLLLVLLLLAIGTA